MAAIDLEQGQIVTIPAIQLTDGATLSGLVRAIQGDVVAIELAADAQGAIPPMVDNSCVMTWKRGGAQRACPVMVRSKSKRALVVQAVFQERREAPRLRAEVKMLYEVVPPVRVTEVAEEVMARVNAREAPDSETNRLLRSNNDPLEQIRQEIATLRNGMEAIMAKLDQLTALVQCGNPSRELPMVKKPLSVCNCSSTGIGFLSDEAYPHGQYLRLHLTLCTVPQVEIDCMGVAVRCRPLEAESQPKGTPRYDVGVRYTHIHENDREHLIHYLFKAQRRMLRDLKEAREEIG